MGASACHVLTESGRDGRTISGSDPDINFARIWVQRMFTLEPFRRLRVEGHQIRSEIAESCLRIGSIGCAHGKCLWVAVLGFRPY